MSVTACAVGPNYRQPPVPVPEVFKEGVEWQRAEPNPQGAVSSAWWLEYRDDELTRLVEQALRANQSIAAAEANYRLARAAIAANVALLYPTVSAGLTGTRSEYGRSTGQSSTTAAGTQTSGATQASGGTQAGTGAQTVVSAYVSASWEPDLWGGIRRDIEASKDSAQATDAQLAGARLSIAASVATDYFELRQADVDIEFLALPPTGRANPTRRSWPAIRPCCSWGCRSSWSFSAWRPCTRAGRFRWPYCWWCRWGSWVWRLSA